VVEGVADAAEFNDIFKKPDTSENVFEKLRSTYGNKIFQVNLPKGSSLVVLKEKQGEEAEQVLGVTVPAGERSLLKDGLVTALDFKRTRYTTLRGGEAGDRNPDNHIMMFGRQGDKLTRNRDDNTARRGRGAAFAVYATPRTSEQTMFDLEEKCLKYIVDDAEAEISRVRPAQAVTEEFALGNNGFYSIAPFRRPNACVQCVGMTRDYSSGVHGDPDSAPGGYECIMHYPSDDYDGSSDFLQFYRHGETLVVVRHTIPHMYSCTLGVGAHMTTKSPTHKGHVMGIAHIIKPAFWRKHMDAHREYNKRVYQCIRGGTRPEFVRDDEHVPEAAARTPPLIQPPLSPRPPLAHILPTPERQRVNYDSDVRSTPLCRVGRMDTSMCTIAYDLACNLATCK
jgi:hypothetical protein